MERNLRFVLILGRLATLKNKIGADYEQVLRPAFSCFRGQKKVLELKKKYCSIHTKMHNIFFYQKMGFFLIFLIFFAKNRLDIHNQLCIVLLEIPPYATFV